MSFMNPWLLLAAAGISLPILAHLLNRYQVKQTDWAAMQFLNRSVRVRSRQLKLRDIILLIMRCIAMLCLVLAVAKPFAEKAEGVVSRLGERRAGVVIALDVSYSMQHSDGKQTRFQKAIEKLEEIADGIHPGAPVSIILLGDEHRIVVRNMAYNDERFGEVIQDLKSQPEQLKLDTVPGELSRLVDSMDAIQKEVYIVTDLQKKDWERPSSWFRDAMTDLDEKAATFIVPVSGKEQEQENLAVTDFVLFSGLLRKGTVARYRATVRNNGNQPAHRVRVRCVMNGINVDSKTISTIPPKASQTVSFFVPFHNAGSVKLSAELEKDGLPLDDIRRAVANIRGKVSILCVEGKSYGTSLESFVTKALRARGSTSKKEDFKVRSVSWLGFRIQDLPQYDVVVLSDVPEVTEDQAKKLRDWVSEGNGLIWFGGESMKAAVWNERSAMKDGDLLPARIGAAEKVSNEMGIGRPIDPILPEHPVCRPLRSLPKDLLSETQFHKMLKVEPLPSSTAVLNLSGSSTPILLQHGIGRGHVFMFATSANPSWNNMALTPVFPMLIQQMVVYLTGREFEKSQIVGNSLSLSYPDRPDASNGVFETPSGEIIEVPVREHAGQFVAFLEHAREAGFYVARVSVQSPGMPIAVNLNTSESDVTCQDISVAQAELADTGVTVTESIGGFTDEIRTGHEYGRGLMIACLVMLLVEGTIASGILRGKSTPARPPLQTAAEAEGA